VDSEKGAKSGVSEGYADPENLTPQLNAVSSARFSKPSPRKRLARKIVGLQALTVLAAAGVAYGWKGSPQYAIAVLGGGGVSVLNGALLRGGCPAALHSSHDAHLQYGSCIYTLPSDSR